MWAVRLSAKEESQSIVNETLRVISHGVLHCIGFKDKNDTEKSKMRIKEKEFIDLFHVKHKSNV
jgi:ssRNA-specific RNase YbeY (16S rRNA maturation enzyme)